MEDLYRLIDENYKSDITKRIYMNFINTLAKRTGPKKIRNINFLYNTKKIMNFLNNNYTINLVKTKLGYLIGILNKTKELAKSETAKKKHDTAIRKYKKELDLINLGLEKEGLFKLTPGKKYPVNLYKKRMKEASQ